MMTIPALSAAGVITYTQGNSSCSGCVPLGFPVPLPIESQTPVAGFRSYTALQARLVDLGFSTELMTREQIGSTLHGEKIYAFVLGDTSRPLTADGFLKPAFLQNATIHAREWSV